MEASHVWKNYLDVGLHNNAYQLKFQMAPNCVLDWFGRNIRGPVKIHDYLRKEISTQYEHIGFEKAEACGPIECKPSHHKTRKFVTDEIDYINPRNKVSGISSLKLFAESDEEEMAHPHENSVDFSQLPAGHKTPERTDNNVLEALTPPASRRKEEWDSATATDEDADESEDCAPVKAKRLKRTNTTSPFSYLRRLPSAVSNMSTKRKTLTRSEVRTLLDDSSSDEDEIETGTYTSLRYMEVSGVLRSKAGQHQEFSTTTSAQTTSLWDRPVRIRISYRQRFSDDLPQYALIIYEHALNKAPSRRNLMLEFTQVAEQLTAAHGDEQFGAIGAFDESRATLSAETVEEQPALVVSPADGATVVATVATPSTEEIAAALESAAFTIVPMHTPTKTIHTPPATPKRKPRLPHAMSGLKRLNLSPSTSTPKRSAVRSLRL